MKRLNISVIICCYNSACRLPETLKHLAFQELPPGFLWELIIVDNNSSDHTADIARDEWRKHELDIPFKVIQEPKPGLSYARKAGIAAASFELLLFCDDDNWLAGDYLFMASKIMQQRPDTGVLGGFSEPVFESAAPDWFADFQHAYAVGKQLPSSGLANSRRYLSGAGMVVRKSIFEALEAAGFEQLLTDRKGASLSSGGDSEICLVVLFLGFDLYYDERLKFYHFMPSNRLNWQYCSAMIAEAHGLPQVYFSFYKILYDSLLRGDPVAFEQSWRIVWRKSAADVVRQFRGVRQIGGSLKALTGAGEGAWQGIVFRSAGKKLLFMMRHKRLLRQQYTGLQKLVKRLLELNRQYHQLHRESYFVSRKD